MQFNPYLHFNGRCEEALAFYEQALGAKAEMVLRYKDAPPSDQHAADPAVADWIMHARVHLGDGVLMMSDGPCSGLHDGYSLSLSPDSIEAGQQLFDALADGGQVTMPYTQTFWAQRFGMVKDKFGVLWMINVAAPGQAI